MLFLRVPFALKGVELVVLEFHIIDLTLVVISPKEGLALRVKPRVVFHSLANNEILPQLADVATHGQVIEITNVMEKVILKIPL
jgi:hypothetical protein